jgi:hypothetical protein
MTLRLHLIRAMARCGGLAKGNVEKRSAIHSTGGGAADLSLIAGGKV